MQRTVDFGMMLMRWKMKQTFEIEHNLTKRLTEISVKEAIEYYEYCDLNNKIKVREVRNEKIN